MDVNELAKRKEGPNVYEAIRRDVKKTTDIKSICKRREQAKQDLDMWRGMLETAYNYAVPNYNPFLNYGRGGAVAKGQVHNADIYDLTLPIAHERLVNKMLTGMVPQSQQWCKFMPGSSFGPEGSPEYKDALEVTQQITDAWFKIIDRSNFYLAVSESFSDVLISTGFLTINAGPKSDPIRFEAAPASQVYIEGNAIGSVTAVFRDWIDVRVETIPQLWPEAKMPNNKKPDDKITIWECAYIDYNADENERYVTCILTSDKEVLFEDRSASWAWVIYRMRKLAGEVRGRGPSLTAYPSAATINYAVGDELMAAAFQANPMYMAASDSAYNSWTFSAKPGAIIPVQMIMGDWPIQAFPGGGNINFSAMVISDFRQQINEVMFASPLGPVSAPDKTATESQIRYQENLEAFSAMVPRVQSEFFEPVIKRSMYLMNQVVPETFANVDPKIKDKLISVNGDFIDLKFETPLMTARGQLKTQSIMSFVAALQSIVGPEAASAAIEPAALVQQLAENQGIKMSLVKSQEEINQILEKAGEVAATEVQQSM